MSANAPLDIAPELDVSRWLNTAEPLSLAGLKGKVVVLHAFQMLCPGCVSHGIPQAGAIHDLYGRLGEVQVIGLHTVFEHHSVMTVSALEAFVHEYRVAFPIAVDRPSKTSAIPHTMQRFQMRGTPTLIVIDKQGYMRLSHFGRMSDLQLGGIIGGLLQGESTEREPQHRLDNDTSGCDDGCSV